LELPAQLESSPAWRQVRAELIRALGETTFEIWFAQLQPQAWDGSVLTLNGPATKRRWISGRYAETLERCVRSGFGAAARVTFSSERGRAMSNPADTDSEPEPSALDFNPRYSFDQFIIGDGNRLAHAASLAVAELPGQAYNPLFLHAPPGLGKTHLLHAIGNYVLSFGGGAVVRYTTVEAFTNHFIRALGSRSIDRFKQAYRDADVLLIDDVQFLASKAKTEEEFFHTFNALYDAGRQLVLTCDRLPSQLAAVEERLRERFESGLVAVIKPPDHATRVAILRKRAALDHIAVTDGAVLELIAERITDNVRVLEGALIRLVAYHSLTQLPIDVQLAEAVLDEIHPRPKQDAPTSVGDIQRAVASYYGLALAQLTSSSRAASVTWPRQVAIHLTRALTDASLHAIGDAFGGRNHTTVLHACKRVSERMRNDQQAVHEVDELTSIIDRSSTDRPS
jgi:chromosomal replication initiator protein